MNGIADYEFVQLLGRGSQGSMWLARSPERLRLNLDYVAVKTLAHRASEPDFDRITMELRRFTAIDSSRLVKLFDVGQQGGVLFIVGEYLPDGSLAQPARPFTRASVLSAIADAAVGTHALHELGLAHRSIKPSNILIDGTTAKLAELGLAHLLNPGQTITGLDHIGSIDYFAPELIKGEVASRASDVWALGATMHRVLTGRSIFPNVPDGSLVEALRFLLSEQPTLNDSLGHDERIVINLALSADPSNRQQTALDLAKMVSELAHRYTEAAE